MPRLSWNEIQDRATEFASKYAGETYEKGESQSFWSDFLNVYGIDRKRHGAYFEYAIKKVSGAQGFVDMFWPGKLLAEQKSAGRDLSKASVQAFEYLDTMPDHDLPIGIVVSDFANFQYIELGEKNDVTSFKLQDFPKHVRLFAFLIEEQSRKLAEENPVNRKAAEAMASLHNTLRDTGYTGHDLELLLVRLVFCMFADDSGIFEHRSFETYLYNRTEIDGTDFGPRLINLFKVLNQDIPDRSLTLDQDLKIFPYINGGLFAEKLDIPDFNYAMRDALLKAMELDWSQVSPAIFGSMFQGVMDEKQRRNLGAHYTSEVNILKVIKPLFLDDLYAEFALVRHQKKKLAEFHDKLASLTFLDPACGCGNFLVISYRELRKLEHKVLEALYGKTLGMFDAHGDGVGIVKCDVDQMYGIEIEEFPSLIAETALWLTDHQMNNEFSKESGKTFKRIPLVKHANIHHANALVINWADAIEPSKLNYILGNPPFIGYTYQTSSQKAELNKVTSSINSSGSLDFVTGWFVKTVQIMDINNKIQAALVSTNSITQGEQASILWKYLFSSGVKINFAHRTFKWTNDAKGIAAVHCVIIGFSLLTRSNKQIFAYDNDKLEPIEIAAKRINQYLTDAPVIIIEKRRNPVQKHIHPISKGSIPYDGGNFILSDDEKAELFKLYPNIRPYIKTFLGSKEFINSINRWCLWLVSISPLELRTMPLVLERVSEVRRVREISARKNTRDAANIPSIFGEIRQPKGQYLAIPEVSSQNREYIPVGFLSNEIIASNKLYTIDGATLYDFAVINSAMHNSWTREVTGRLKSDIQYSAGLVYNNFIWPEQVSEAQKQEIEKFAQGILDARANYPDATLADLYDPLTMPPDLAKAHKILDKAVDKLYQKEPFTDDTERVALLFNLYQQKTNASKTI